MRMATGSVVGREFIHWVWLWILAAIVITVLQKPATGRTSVRDEGSQVSGEGFGALAFQSSMFESENVALDDVLLLNRRRDYKAVIGVWQKLDMTRDSATWKNIGVGVAHLRLENLEKAQQQFERAIELDPGNAVAEYFLGRVCQARSRKIPFWYEKDDESSVRLMAYPPVGIADNERGQDRGDAFLPHFKTLPFEKQAKQHFHRAISLSGACQLDRAIEIIEPRLRLIGYGSESNAITIRDLLISLDEENYVEKARSEVLERFVSCE